MQCCVFVSIAVLCCAVLCCGSSLATGLSQPEESQKHGVGTYPFKGLSDGGKFSMRALAVCCDPDFDTVRDNANQDNHLHRFELAVIIVVWIFILLTKVT